MTITEAKATIYANVVYACKKAGLAPQTTRLVQDACDTIIAIADACETIVALADRKTENNSEIPNNCEDCIWSVCNYNKAFEDEPTISKMEQVDEPTEITYQNCSDALLKMWMDNVLTDGEFNRIMDKLNKADRKTEPTISKMEQVEDEPQTDVYDYKGNGKWERNE